MIKALLLVSLALVAVSENVSPEEQEMRLLIVHRNMEALNLNKWQEKGHPLDTRNLGPVLDAALQERLEKALETIGHCPENLHLVDGHYRIVTAVRINMTTPKTKRVDDDWRIMRYFADDNRLSAFGIKKYLCEKDNLLRLSILYDIE
uniref:ParB domain-containing protein n=2 Tax=Caenorhabditis tropicalis TaxID=1561998 RepID=A0A1I7U5A6_9PELO